MQDEAPRKPLHSADKTAEEELTIPQDWESRLADARERRRKVLAEKAAANGGKGSDATPAKTATLPVKPTAKPIPTDWEKRLDAARAKRLKILADRHAANAEASPPTPAEKPQPEPGTNRAFPLAVANAAAPRATPIAAPETSAKALGANVVPIPTRPSTAKTKEPVAAPMPPQAMPDPPNADVAPQKRRIGLVPLVAFACFFGVGLGLAIGWALVSAWTDTGSPVVAEAPTPAPASVEEVAIVSRAAPLSVTAPLPRPRREIALGPVNAVPDLAIPGAFATGTEVDQAAAAPALLPPTDASLSRTTPGTLIPTATGTAQPDAANVVAARPALSFQAPEWAAPALPPAALSDGTLVAFSDAPPSAFADGATLTLAALDRSFVPPVPLGQLETPVTLTSPTLVARVAQDDAPGVFGASAALPEVRKLATLAAPDAIDIALPARPTRLPQANVAATLAEVPAPKVPDAATNFARPSVATRLAPQDAPSPTVDVAALNWTMPEIGDAPAPLGPLNFIQSIGLTPNQAAAFGLYLHAPGSISDGTLADYENRLTATGLDLRTTRRVQFKISKTQIRYYSDSDRALAKGLADELGIIARDFTANGGPAGRIEIWMQGESGIAKPTPQRTTRVTTTRRSQPTLVERKARIINNIIEGLRSNK